MSKTIIEQYRPLGKNTDFLAYRDEKGRIKQLKNSKFGYFITIRQLGYVPKTGILLSQFLEKIPFYRNSKILDVGTGESALLAIHSSFLGAEKVLAIDIDKNAIKWARKNVKRNKLSSKIKIIKKSVADCKLNFYPDIIISNPSQMPVKQRKSLHDDGGKDGKYYIIKLIKLANKILKSGGRLIFTVFDFLGVEKSYNTKESLLNILKKYSFNPKIAKTFNKEINKSSYTFKNLNHIKEIYPGYIFSKNKNNLYEHKIFIICAQKLKHKK